MRRTVAVSARPSSASRRVVSWHAAHQIGKGLSWKTKNLLDIHPTYENMSRVVADVWKKDVWEFQAKSGSSGVCCLLLHFLGKIEVQEMSGKTPGSPRHPSSRQARPSGCRHDFRGPPKIPKYHKKTPVFKRRTNVQQLTCKIDSSNSFYYLFFSFIILELKPLVLKGKVRGEKI